MDNSVFGNKEGDTAQCSALPREGVMPAPRDQSEAIDAAGKYPPNWLEPFRLRPSPSGRARFFTGKDGQVRSRTVMGNRG